MHKDERSRVAAQPLAAAAPSCNYTPSSRQQVSCYIHTTSKILSMTSKAAFLLTGITSSVSKKGQRLIQVNESQYWLANLDTVPSEAMLCERIQTMFHAITRGLDDVANARLTCLKVWAYEAGDQAGALQSCRGS
ncbi:hypothetical protein WJX77_007612 [Trebouxia sp. C0004]